jgi:fatty acid desaturase
MALRVFLLAEHVDCPHVTNMFENTRTTFTTRLVCLITWNASYHIEHHTYPTVPFYNLPLLHQAMRQELKVTADGYAKFTKDFLLQH